MAVGLRVVPSAFAPSSEMAKRVGYLALALGRVVSAANTRTAEIKMKAPTTAGSVQGTRLRAGKGRGMGENLKGKDLDKESKALSASSPSLVLATRKYVRFRSFALKPMHLLARA